MIDNASNGVLVYSRIIGERVPSERQCLSGHIAVLPERLHVVGRSTIGIQLMRCAHFLQHWFELVGPGAEEALYYSHAMHKLFGVDLGEEPMPNLTTLSKTQHLLEQHSLRSVCFLFGQGISREPLFNLVISLRHLRLVVGRLSQLMVLVLNKKGNAANGRRRTRLSARGCYGAYRNLT